ncbi:cytidine deaminase [Treponema sp.]|uniref:cytidine deaminase n=1 Tax=Treponema sp. TaxID=166 RepID=UPI0025E91452|nr:cytidine deaminase [Treponema sp.]MCR5219014.1 cytidine deaminase [Treponema sp.]
MEKNEMYKKLISEAIKMLDFSYVPYSHFHVGAALLTDQDQIYTGCNIENSAFGPTNCAERTAFFKAISEGKKSFKAIAIVGGPDGKIKDYCPPCGVCRQVMREFCKNNFEVILAKSPDEYIVKTLEEILPLSFGSEDLEK